MMKLWIVSGVALAMVAGVGAAVAQAPAPPPPEGPPAMEGPPGFMRHFGGRHMRPPPSKAARFMFRKGDSVVAIKCADDEPTKACVDAGSALLDKLATH